MSKPTKQELEKLYLEDGKTLTEIGNIFNVSMYMIDYYRRSYGIPTRGQVFKQHEIPFNEKQIQIIRGLLLGDGYMCIPTNSKNPQLQVEHSINQEDYLIWLHRELQPHSHKITYRQVKPHKIRGVMINGEKTACRFRTVCHPQLNELYKLYYPNGKRVITSEILNKCDLLSIAVWFMDNGSRSRESLKISTGIHEPDVQYMIIKWFKDTFDLDAYLNWGGYTYTVTFSMPSSRVLRDMLYPYIIPSLRYKINF